LQIPPTPIARAPSCAHPYPDGEITVFQGPRLSVRWKPNDKEDPEPCAPRLEPLWRRRVGLWTRGQDCVLAHPAHSGTKIKSGQFTCHIDRTTSEARYSLEPVKCRKNVTPKPPAALALRSPRNGRLIGLRMRSVEPNPAIFAACLGVAEGERTVRLSPAPRQG
jgi:hypothetical protein